MTFDYTLNYIASRGLYNFLNTNFSNELMLFLVFICLVLIYVRKN